MKIKASILLVLAAAAVAALWPAAAAAADTGGVVVAKRQGTMLVATPSGLVRAVAGRAAIGSRVVGSRVVGRATTARIRGVVFKQVGTTLFVSSNRHLLAIRTGRRLSSASVDPGPTPGTVVSTTVDVQSNGQLHQKDEHKVGHHGDRLQIQAVVTAVGAGTVTLSVGGQSVTVKLPAGLTLPQSIVGQTVTISVSLKDNDGEDDDDDDDDDDEDDDD